HDALLGEIAERLLEADAAERLARGERQLEGGTADVIHQDQQLVRIEARVLRTRAEEEVRMASEVLVERVARADEHPDRAPLAPARAAESLQCARDRAGIAVQDANIQCADVHPELQRRSGDDAIEAPRAELRLFVAPVRRQVATAVGRDARGLARIAVEQV